MKLFELMKSPRKWHEFAKEWKTFNDSPHVFNPIRKSSSHSGLRKVPEAFMCSHPSGTYDVIGNALIKDGRWMDCAILPELWRKSVQELKESGVLWFDKQITLPNGKKVIQKKKKKLIFLDVGSNIGACLVEMLVTVPEIDHILAFEPHPQNVYRLTTTLSMMPEEFRSKVIVCHLG